jgi:hypothetical protein
VYLVVVFLYCFCDVWVCVCVSFVVCGVFGQFCGCFGNMFTCVYCVFVLFRLCIFVFVLPLLMQGLLPPSENSIAVNTNSNLRVIIHVPYLPSPLPGSSAFVFS